MKDKDIGSSEDEAEESNSEDCLKDPITALSEPLVHIDRLALTQPEFHSLYGLEEGKLEQVYKDGWGSIRRSCRRYVRKAKEVTFTRIIFSMLPILRWFPKYNWKRDFPSDVAAG